MLTIRRWREMEKRNPSDGLSWWIIIQQVGLVPPSRVIRRIFERTTDAGIKLKTQRNRGHYVFVGMQVGLSRQDRKDFLRILDCWHPKRK